MSIISIKQKLQNERVLAVLAPSVYQPTSQKLQTLAAQYASAPDIAAFGDIEEDAVRGVIILKPADSGCWEILRISCAPDHRRRGVARGLIAFALRKTGAHTLLAETDDDAVDFYRRCGFSVAPMGELYPGVSRYRCILSRP